MMKRLRTGTMAISVICVFLVSMLSSAAISAETLDSLLDQYPGTVVAYCSKPLKVGSDNRYFFFVSGEKNSNEPIEIRFVRGLDGAFVENLNPPDKAEAIKEGSALKFKGSGAFIVHGKTEGIELVSAKELRLVPVEKCDELVAGMAYLNKKAQLSWIGGNKDIVDKLLLVAEESYKALAESSLAENFPCFVDDNPDNLIKDGTLACAVTDTETFVKERFLNLDSDFLALFNDYVKGLYSESEKPMESVEVFEQRLSERFLRKVISPRVTDDMIFRKWQNHIETAASLEKGDFNELVNRLATERIFWISGKSSFGTFEEALNDYYSYTGLKFKVELSEQDSGMLGRLEQIIKKHGTGSGFLMEPLATENLKTTRITILKQDGLWRTVIVSGGRPLVLGLEGTHLSLAEKSPTGIDASLVFIGNEKIPFQRLMYNLFHEVSHAVAATTDADTKIWKSVGLNSYEHKLLSEGLASKLTSIFAARQHEGLNKAGITWSGFDYVDFNFLRNSAGFKLEEERLVFGARHYVEAKTLYDYIEIEYGAESLKKIVTGEILASDFLDILEHYRATVNQRLREAKISFDDINSRETGAVRLLREQHTFLSTVFDEIDGQVIKFDRVKIEDIDSRLERQIKSVPPDIVTSYYEYFPEAIISARQVTQEAIRSGKVDPANVEKARATSTMKHLKILKRIYLDFLEHTEGVVLKVGENQNIENAIRSVNEATRFLKQIAINDPLSSKFFESLDKASNSRFRGKVEKFLYDAKEASKEAGIFLKDIMAPGKLVGTGVAALSFALADLVAELGTENGILWTAHIGYALQFIGLAVFLQTWAGIVAPAILESIVAISLGLVAEGLAGLVMAGVSVLTGLVIFGVLVLVLSVALKPLVSLLVPTHP